MSEPTFDINGYPGDETLRTIAEWPLLKSGESYDPLMEYIKKAWRDGFWSFENVDGDDTTIYSISTGGWSGNEAIIQAMESNRMFWMICWVQTRRGGHYEFETRVMR